MIVFCSHNAVCSSAYFYLLLLFTSRNSVIHEKRRVGEFLLAPSQPERDRDECFGSSLLLSSNLAPLHTHQLAQEHSAVGWLCKGFGTPGFVEDTADNFNSLKHTKILSSVRRINYSLTHTVFARGILKFASHFENKHHSDAQIMSEVQIEGKEYWQMPVQWLIFQQ